jgi:hypothetical protein
VRERRSLASVVFRAAMHPKVGAVAVLLMVGGWTLALTASFTPVDVPFPPDSTGAMVRFLVTVIGGALAFMGMFAGISRWVAEPAARKVMAEHIAERERAHDSYVPRLEWDVKHEELKREINGLAKTIVALTASLETEKRTTAKGRRDS